MSEPFISLTTYTALLPKDERQGVSAAIKKYIDENGKEYTVPQIRELVERSKTNAEAKEQLNHIRRQIRKLGVIPDVPEPPIYTKARSLMVSDLLVYLNEYGISVYEKNARFLFPALTDTYTIPRMAANDVETFFGSTSAKLEYGEDGRVVGVHDPTGLVVGITESVTEKGQRITKSVGIGKAKVTIYVYDVTLRGQFPDFLAPGGKREPSYYPRYYTVGAWYELLILMQSKLGYGDVGSNEKEIESFTNLYIDLVDLVENNRFTNGNAKSQIGRLRAVRDVAEIAKKTRKAKDYTDAITKSLTMRYTMIPEEEAKGVINYDVDDMFEMARRVVKSREGGEGVPMKMNYKANAGPVWKEGTKNADVEVQMHLLATLLFKDITAAIKKDGVPNVTNMHLPKYFWEKWGWTQLSFFSPKAEVYSNTDLNGDAEGKNRKVRNIAIYNSGVMYPAKLFVTFIQNNLVKWSQKPLILSQKKVNPGSFVGSGFTPFKSGADFYFRALFNKLGPDMGTTIVYADNVFLLYKLADGTGIHYSLDASKMEASVTPELITVTLNHFINICRRRGMHISSTWETYLTNFFPRVAVLGTALLNKFQFEWGCMGSGTIGTFLWNTVAMGLVFEQFWTKNASRKIFCPIDRKGELRPEFFQAIKDMGIVIKVELVAQVPSLDLELRLPSEHAGQLQKADLLGFDAAIFEIDKDLLVYLPVLAYDRLTKSLVFRKKHYKGDEASYSDIVMSFLTVVRLKALYLMGGWFYPAIAGTILFMVGRELYKIDKLVTAGADEAEINNLVGSLSTVLESLGDDDFMDSIEFLPQLANILATSSLPTIYEIVYLGTNNKDYADRAVNSRRGLTPDVFLYPLRGYTEDFGPIKDSFPYSEVPARFALANNIPILNFSRSEQPLIPLVTSKPFVPTRTKVELVDASVSMVGPPRRDTYIADPKTSLSKDKYSEKFGRLSKILRGGAIKMIFRVPIPDQYWPKRKLMDKKERLVIARALFVQQLTSELSVPREHTQRALKSLFPNVLFICDIGWMKKNTYYDLPLARTEKPKSSQALDYDKMFASTPTDVSSKRLVPDRVLYRKVYEDSVW
jgi:hypothetical protein